MNDGQQAINFKQAKVQQDNCFCLFVCISSHQALMIMVIEQWGFFSVPHLLWHGTLVYNGNLRGPVTVTPVVEFWQWSYIVQNLKPFTGNGDVSIWVDNSRVERITQNKQTNQTKQTLPVELLRSVAAGFRRPNPSACEDNALTNCFHAEDILRKDDILQNYLN